MKRKWNKFACVGLLLVSLLVISFYPAVSSAADNADLKAQIQALAEAEVLKPFPHLGTCTSIQFKVRVGNVFELVDIPDNRLKVAVPYEIYWYPDSDNGLVDGKKVHQGILDVKSDNQTFLVKYDPKSNPHGAKGKYVLKVKLDVNGQVIEKMLIAKLVLKDDCGTDRPGTPGDPGDGTQPGAPNDPGHQDDPKNPPDGNGGDDGKGDDGKSEDPKQPQGGKLPKTASSYGNNMMIGLGGMLLGTLLYALFHANRKKPVAE